MKPHRYNEFLDKGSYLISGDSYLIASESWFDNWYVRKEINKISSHSSRAEEVKNDESD